MCTLNHLTTVVNPKTLTQLHIKVGQIFTQLLYSLNIFQNPMWGLERWLRLRAFVSPAEEPD